MAQRTRAQKIKTHQRRIEVNATEMSQSPLYSYATVQKKAVATTEPAIRPISKDRSSLQLTHDMIAVRKELIRIAIGTVVLLSIEGLLFWLLEIQKIHW